MKKIIVGLSILFLIFSLAPAQAAFTVYADIDGNTTPDTEITVLPGDNFIVEIYAGDLPPVFSGGFDLTYDPLQVDVVTNPLVPVNPPWNNNLSPTTDDGNGLIQFNSGYFNAANPSVGLSGALIPLLSIEFMCIAPGTSDLVFQDPPAASGRGFFGAGQQFPAYTNLTVSQVPIPPTVLLLGAGLVGLVGIRRRVKS